MESKILILQTKDKVTHRCKSTGLVVQRKKIQKNKNNKCNKFKFAE